jgi:hypothetical protein
MDSAAWESALPDPGAPSPIPLLAAAHGCAGLC